MDRDLAEPELELEPVLELELERGLEPLVKELELELVLRLEPEPEPGLVCGGLRGVFFRTGREEERGTDDGGEVPCCAWAACLFGGVVGLEGNQRGKGERGE